MGDARLTSPPEDGIESTEILLRKTRNMDLRVTPV
jgi:hypothetical protein